MKKKKWLAVLTATAVVCSLAACGNTKPEEKAEEAVETPVAAEEETGGEAEEEKSLKIGLSMFTLEYPFYVTMCDAFEEACEEKGYEVITTNGSTDATTQLNNCLDLINKGIDVMVLTSWYGDALAEAFDLCEEKGIPIFIMDTSNLPEGGKYVTRIGTVNEDAGYVGGLYVGKYLTDNGIDTVDTVLLDSGDEVSTARKDGYLKGLEEKGITVNVMNEYFCSSREEAMANMEDALTTYSEIDLVIGTSAQHGLGAYSACVSAGREEMLIASMDGEKEEMEEIDKKGIYLCTITQDPAGMSKIILENIEGYMFDGETFDEFQSMPAGVYSVEGQISADELE